MQNTWKRVWMCTVCSHEGVSAWKFNTISPVFATVRPSHGFPVVLRSFLTCFRIVPLVFVVDDVRLLTLFVPTSLCVVHWTIVPFISAMMLTTFPALQRLQKARRRLMCSRPASPRSRNPSPIRVPATAASPEALGLRSRSLAHHQLSCAFLIHCVLLRVLLLRCHTFVSRLAQTLECSLCTFRRPVSWQRVACFSDQKSELHRCRLQFSDPFNVGGQQHLVV